MYYRLCNSKLKNTSSFVCDFLLMAFAFRGDQAFATANTVPLFDNGLTMLVISILSPYLYVIFFLRSLLDLEVIKRLPLPLLYHFLITMLLPQGGTKMLQILKPDFVEEFLQPYRTSLLMMCMRHQQTQFAVSSLQGGNRRGDQCDRGRT